jgi:hypothetical protein
MPAFTVGGAIAAGIAAVEKAAGAGQAIGFRGGASGICGGGDSRCCAGVSRAPIERGCSLA